MNKVIYLAGGCFWGCQKYFDLMDGVLSTEVGYANGPTANPTYEQVKHDHSGHAETVKVEYDPAVLPLKTLLENQDIVLSRDVLLNKVCGYDYAGETNVVDVYIRYQRSKIDDVFGVKMIRTVRGVGYVIKSET